MEINYMIIPGIDRGDPVPGRPVVSKNKYTLDFIARFVCGKYRLPVEDVFRRTRKRAVSEPRQVICWAAVKAGYSLSEIRDYFGFKNHTSVLYASRNLPSIAKYDAKIRTVLDEIHKGLTI